RRAADRAADLPDPPTDAARLPALLPVHDQPRAQRRLAGTEPGPRPATCPPLRHPGRQSDGRDRPHAAPDAPAGGPPPPAVRPASHRLPRIPPNHPHPPTLPQPP